MTYSAPDGDLRNALEEYTPPASDNVTLEYRGRPQPPRIIEVVDVTGRRAALEWDDYDALADSFAVLVRAEGVRNWTVDGTVAVDDGGRQSYETSALLDGQRYYAAIEVTDIFGNTARASTIDVAAGETLEISSGETETVASPFAVAGTVSNSGTIDTSR